MSHASSILVSLTILILGTSSHAQTITSNFQVLPESEYKFTFGGFSGIEGCSPNEFQCNFIVAGSFTVTEDIASQTATFDNVDFTLIGNEEVVADRGVLFIGGTIPEFVNELLDNSVLDLLPTAGPTTVYQRLFSNGTLRLSLLGDIATIAGGSDSTPSDGVAFDYDVTGQMIPEPATTIMLGFGVVSMLVRRRFYE